MHGCKGAGSLGEEEGRMGREGKIDKSVKVNQKEKKKVQWLRRKQE